MAIEAELSLQEQRLMTLKDHCGGLEDVGDGWLRPCLVLKLRMH